VIEPDQDAYDVLFPDTLVLTIPFVPQDLASQNYGVEKDGYTFCGARTLNLFDSQTETFINITTSEIFKVEDTLLTFTP